MGFSKANFAPFYKPLHCERERTMDGHKHITYFARTLCQHKYPVDLLLKFFMAILRVQSHSMVLQIGSEIVSNACGIIQPRSLK